MKIEFYSGHEVSFPQRTIISLSYFTCMARSDDAFLLYMKQFLSILFILYSYHENQYAHKHPYILLDSISPQTSLVV